ncbi:hypothetical protein LIER_01126 [Lithospermum erythrorhizon]|uniref:Bifunctional inhibitor/plant lipid transfer protein/seed storage helical domain-containing protein n=1 Tax=Lithospermum erythrorhizon TaxID=34254 RepID=A0AAV3NJW6_LITER
MGKLGSELLVLQLAMVMLLVIASQVNSQSTPKSICGVKISELALCIPAISGESPPRPTKGCCNVIKKADLRCLCSFKSQLVNYGVKPENAMALPKKCYITKSKIPKACK